MAYKILVVDDSLPMRAVIKKTIKASGYGTTDFMEASNGREALEQMESEWLDLVITDYNMPKMNGLQLIEEMKKDEVLKAIPVLVVTTEGSRAKVDEFMEKGAVDYVKKPFTPEEIRQKLTQILGEAEDEGDVEDGDEDFDF